MTVRRGGHFHFDAEILGNSQQYREEAERIRSMRGGQASAYGGIEIGLKMPAGEGAD
jgi:hypothetical protein